LKKRYKILIALLITGILIGLFLFSISTAIPNNVQINSLTQVEQQQGREIMKLMLQAHGGKEQFNKFKTAKTIFRHDITFAPYRWMFGFYGHNPQLIKMTTLIGTDNGRVEFIDGPNNKLQWGIQNWACYKIAPNSKPVFEQSFDAFFYIPTGAYFQFLPFRIQEANKVALIGVKEWEGHTYDLVIATWNRFETQRYIDQYVLWINQETRRLDYMTFTVRDQGSFVKATISFNDYRNINGLLLSFDSHIVFGDDPDDVPILHDFKVSSINLFESANEDYFFPKPELRYEKPNISLYFKSLTQ